MPWIDTLINDAFNGQTRAEGAVLGTAATTRPHQLFLGGDQIYADDLSPLHLALCNRLAHRWSAATRRRLRRRRAVECLGPASRPPAKTFRIAAARARPVQNGAKLDLASVDYPGHARQLSADGRYELTLADARFTSVDGESHLLSFGEFAAMYVVGVCRLVLERAEGRSGFDAVANVTTGPHRAPEQRLAAVQPSLLDSKVAEFWFGNARWIGVERYPSRQAGPPFSRATRSKFDQCFASFMLARLCAPICPPASTASAR